MENDESRMERIGELLNDGHMVILRYYPDHPDFEYLYETVISGPKFSERKAEHFFGYSNLSMEDAFIEGYVQVQRDAKKFREEKKKNDVREKIVKLERALRIAADEMYRKEGMAEIHFDKFMGIGRDGMWELKREWLQSKIKEWME